MSGKIKKVIAESGLLLLCLVALVGCNKNNTTEKTQQEKTYELYVQYMSAKGETPLTYEQWLASIKGEKGEDGISPKVRINETTNYWEISTDNGNTWASTGVKATGTNGQAGENGKDGAAWYQGELAPTSQVEGVNGDYYLDTTNKDIYFHNGTTWEFLIDLDEKTKEDDLSNIVLEPGAYYKHTEDETGEFNVIYTLDSEGNWSAKSESVMKFEAGSNIIDFGFVIVGIEDNNMRLGMEGLHEPDSSVTNIDANAVYNIMNQSLIILDENYVINGIVKGNGEIVELTVSSIAYLPDDMEISVIPVTENKLQVCVSATTIRECGYMLLGEQTSKGRELFYTYHFDEGDESLLYGTYTNGNDILTISKNKVLLYYQGVSLSGEYKILFGGFFNEHGSAQVVIEFEIDGNKFSNVVLDLHERRLGIYAPEYSHEGTYVLDGEKIVVVSKNQDGFYTVSMGEKTYVSDIKSIDNHMMEFDINIQIEDSELSLHFNALSRVCGEKTEESVESLKAITITTSELMTKLNNDDTFILYIGANTCAHCKEFNKTINAYISSGNTVYYVDIADTNDPTLVEYYSEIYKRLLEGVPADRNITELATPTTVYVKDGEFVDAIQGAIGMDGGADYDMFCDVVEGKYVGKPSPFSSSEK